jgi:hypothetical protein
MIFANEVQRTISADVRARNGKVVAAIPDVLRRMAEENPIHVFNVGPWSWTVSLGSLGVFTVPANEGEVSKPLIVNRTVFETISVDMNKMEQRPVDGMDVVHDILGVGPYKQPGQSLISRGVFIAEGSTPTAKEKKAAYAELDKYYGSLVSEADRYHMAGPLQMPNICDEHRAAARALNQTRPWCETPRQQDSCPGCGRSVPQGIARCPHEMCGAILDEVKAKKLFPHLFREAVSA